MPAIRAPALLSTLASTLGLFLHARRGLDDPSALPHIERALSMATLDPAWLQAYRACVGLATETDDGLPPLAWQIAAVPLHMAILADARFPFRALGLVHMSQSVTQRKPVPATAALDLRAYTADARWEKRGMSFELVTEARCDGELVWQARTRALAPGRSPVTPSCVEAGRRDFDECNAAPPRVEKLLHVPESCGRRYAAIAGDLNPIHQHALLARPFGFKRAIVHGTWTLARAMAIAGLPGAAAFTLDATFRRPVELPSDILVRAYAGAAERQHRVQVSSPDRSKTYISILMA